MGMGTFIYWSFLILAYASLFRRCGTFSFDQTEEADQDHCLSCSSAAEIDYYHRSRKLKNETTLCAASNGRLDSCWQGQDGFFGGYFPSLLALADVCDSQGGPGRGKMLYLTFTKDGWEKATRAHIDSLARALDPSDMDLLVIDDGSRDETLDELKSRGIKVIRTPNPPQGVTYAWNLGYAYFWANCYEHVFITNNDVVLPIGSIEGMQQGLSSGACDIVGPVSTATGAGRNTQNQAAGLRWASLRESKDPTVRKSWEFLNQHWFRRHLDPMNVPPGKFENATNIVQQFIMKLQQQGRRRRQPPAADKATITRPENCKPLDGKGPASYLNGFFFGLNKKSLAASFDDNHLFNPRRRNTGNEMELQARAVSIGQTLCVAISSFVFHLKGQTIPMTIADRDHWGEREQLQRIQEQNEKKDYY